MERTQIGDVSLELLSAGDGPPLVFLHGGDYFAQHREFFDGLAFEYAAREPSTLSRVSRVGMKAGRWKARGRKEEPPRGRGVGASPGRPGRKCSVLRLPVRAGCQEQGSEPAHRSHQSAEPHVAS